MKKLITEKQIREKVSELAERIASENGSGELHVLFVLKGAFIFCADLVRALESHKVDVTLDYVIAKSYIGKKSSGKVECLVDVDIKKKDVLLVEDIVDTGRTLMSLKTELMKQKPRSLRTVCLLDKPSRRIVEMTVDHVGFEIPDEFVVGYGLDYNERYRHLPYLGIVSEQKGRRKAQGIGKRQ